MFILCVYYNINLSSLAVFHLLSNSSKEWATLSKAEKEKLQHQSAEDGEFWYFYSFIWAVESGLKWQDLVFKHWGTERAVSWLEVCSDATCSDTSQVSDLSCAHLGCRSRTSRRTTPRLRSVTSPRTPWRTTRFTSGRFLWTRVAGWGAALPGAAGTTQVPPSPGEHRVHSFLQRFKQTDELHHSGWSQLPAFSSDLMYF